MKRIPIWVVHGVISVATVLGVNVALNLAFDVHPVLPDFAVALAFVWGSIVAIYFKFFFHF